MQVRGKDGKRLGFDVVTVDGKERAPLARMANAPGAQSGPKVGQYSVNVAEFEKIALRSLGEKVVRKMCNSLSLATTQWKMAVAQGRLVNL